MFIPKILEKKLKMVRQIRPGYLTENSKVNSILISERLTYFFHGGIQSASNKLMFKGQGSCIQQCKKNHNTKVDDRPTGLRCLVYCNYCGCAELKYYYRVRTACKQLTVNSVMIEFNIF